MIDIITNWITKDFITFVTQNTLTLVGIIIGAYIVTLIVTFTIEKVIRGAIHSSAHLTPQAEKKREDTLISILRKTSKIVIWILATLIALSEMGVNIGPLIAAAGIVGIAVGFGGQYLIRDLVTGIFIILENQYRVGDVVRINSAIAGKVEDISLRLTVLRDLDGVVHHVPHGEVKIVSNLSKGYSRVNINFGIAYESDVDAAIALVNRVGIELAEDERFKDIIMVAPACLGVDELGDSSIVLKIVGDTQPAEQWGVAREMRRRLKYACDEVGISIPFPQVTLNYKNDTTKSAK